MCITIQCDDKERYDIPCIVFDKTAKRGETCDVVQANGLTLDVLKRASMQQRVVPPCDRLARQGTGTWQPGCDVKVHYACAAASRQSNLPGAEARCSSLCARGAHVPEIKRASVRMARYSYGVQDLRSPHARTVRCSDDRRGCARQASAG